MDYQGLVKRLNLPTGWTAPTELTNDDIRARALTRDHLHDDVRGINASLELIRRTRGGRWPTEPVTEDFNYVDLVWHLTKTACIKPHRAGRSAHDVPHRSGHREAYRFGDSEHVPGQWCCRASPGR